MSFLSWLLFGPSKLAHEVPPACFAIGAVFLLIQGAQFLFRRQHFGRRFFLMPATFAGLLWMIFGLYELQVQAWEKTVAVAFRIDLIVLVPILYVFTVAALLSLYRQMLPNPIAGGEVGSKDATTKEPGD
jgi:hypothetical protein